MKKYQLLLIGLFVFSSSCNNSLMEGEHTLPPQVKKTEKTQFIRDKIKWEGYLTNDHFVTRGFNPYLKKGDKRGILTIGLGKFLNNDFLKEGPLAEYAEPHLRYGAKLEGAYMLQDDLEAGLSLAFDYNQDKRQNKKQVSCSIKQNLGEGFYLFGKHDFNFLKANPNFTQDTQFGLGIDSEQIRLKQALSSSNAKEDEKYNFSFGVTVNPFSTTNSFEPKLYVGFQFNSL